MKKLKKSGFTTIELIVVIGLIAIIGTFIASRLLSTNTNKTLDSAQAYLSETFANARLTAIGSNKNYHLLYQPKIHSLQLFEEQNDSTLKLIQTFPLSEKITLTTDKHEWLINPKGEFTSLKTAPFYLNYKKETRPLYITHYGTLLSSF